MRNVDDARSLFNALFEREFTIGEVQLLELRLRDLSPFARSRRIVALYLYQQTLLLLQISTS